VTDRIKEAMVRNPTSHAIRALALEDGMRPLRQDGWRLVKAGITTCQEIIRVAKADERAVVQES